MNTPSPVREAPLPVTAGAVPWWTSKQFDGLLATFVIALLGLAAHFIPSLAKITTQQVLNFITDATAVAVALGPLIALIQRARSAVQPLTIGAKSAADHPSTIAVVQTQQAMAAAGIPTAATLQKAIEAAPTVKPEKT
jgi:hypothetical protein